MKLFLPKGRWGDEAMPFDQPSGVVALAERVQRLAQILDRVEGLQPQEIFLQGSDEAFGTAIALGCAKAGELSAPRNSSSLWKASDMYWDP